MADPEKTRLYNRQMYARHRAKRIAQTKAFVAKNPEQTREWKRQWEKRHPAYMRLKEHRRRASLLLAYQDGTATPEFFKALYSAERCFHCKEPFNGQRVHADHLIPLRAYGAPHTAWALVPSCFDCNDRKNDRVSFAAIVRVLATPGGEQWAAGPGAEWLQHVLPNLPHGHRSARALFPKSLVAMEEVTRIEKGRQGRLPRASARAPQIVREEGFEAREKVAR